MGWKPAHEAHAIERVRLLVEFSSPLSEKQLTKFTLPITQRFRDFGFDQIARAESTIQNIVLAPAGLASPVQQQNQNGWVMQRTDKRQVVEEAGFRDGVFGYMSMEYGRWENLASRFWDLFEGPLAQAIESVDISTIKLEYWDKFIFVGNPADANVNNLLNNIDPAIPAVVTNGASLWHSHIGWFESFQNSVVLINRNFDVVDERLSDKTQRACNVLTLVEIRQPREVSTVERLKVILEYIHKRSLLLFGSSLTEEQRVNVNMKMEDYIS